MIDYRYIPVEPISYKNSTDPNGLDYRTFKVTGNEMNMSINIET